MKKKYVRPTMVGEKFTANEYVAACFMINCVTPNNNGTFFTLYDDSDGNGTFNPDTDKELYNSWLGFSGCGTWHKNVEWDGDSIKPNGFVEDWNRKKYPVFYWKDKKGYHSTVAGKENYATNPNAS